MPATRLHAARAQWFVVALVVAACGESSSPSAAPQPAAPSGSVAETPAAVASPEVRHFGALRQIMHEGRTEATVRLTEVVPGPHTFALGALSELRGEVTVLDDVAWVAYPKEDGTADVRTGVTEESATLLVAAKVPRWREVEVTEDVAADQVDAAIERLARAAGIDPSAPFPVRVKGPLVELRWHVIDGSKVTPGASHEDHARTAVSGVEARIEGELLGFFSKSHAGVFTHHDRHTHFHVVVAERPLTGHVDAVALGRGARVLLPAP
jgi:hypothetical protein